MRTFLAFSIAVVVLSSAALAADPGGKFDGKVTSVAVFKNGYGFFRVEGTADVRGGCAELSPVPAASLGTWWFYARKDGVKIVDVVAVQRETVVPRAPLTLDELIAANVGREAVIETETGKYSGLIVGNFAMTSQPPTAPGASPRSSSDAGEPKTYFASDITLKTPEGVVSVRLNSVRSFSITGGVGEYGESKKEGYVTLRMSGAPDGPVPVGCQFLQKGIRWIPSYRVELVDDKTVSLVLQGEVIDDIHDLDHSTLQLVVGMPNFASADILSPLAYVSQLPRLSIFFPDPNRRDGRSATYAAGNVFMYQNANFEDSDLSYAGGSYPTPAAPVPAEFAVSPEIASKGVSDLFYYTKENVSLKAGERASLNLLSATTGYKDIYKWTVVDKTLRGRPEYSGVYRRYMQGEFEYAGNLTPDISRKLAELNRQDIAQHYLRIVNETGKPLTTGPALIFSRGDILAQDTLDYTPAGGNVDLRITAASDIGVAQKEEETSRNRNALNSYGRSYDLVQATVTLTVKNYKKETVHMVVTKPFDGTVVGTIADASVTQDTSELTSVNPHTRVEWEFDLEPGASREMRIAYSTYVREQ